MLYSTLLIHSLHSTQSEYEFCLGWCASILRQNFGSNRHPDCRQPWNQIDAIELQSKTTVTFLIISTRTSPFIVAVNFNY